MKAGTVTLGNIFRIYGQHYMQNMNPAPQQCKVIRAISRCRTQALGADIYHCPHCGYEHVVFHSCRNRHCPLCQFSIRERWLAARKDELLPVSYFHIVFTLPDKLNALIYANTRPLYDLLFKAASQTVLKLAADKKHIGGKGGLLAILHTWGQNLSFHPHLHCVVPGGALSLDGNRWLYPKKSKRKKKFFIHVRVLSNLFMKIYLSQLKNLYHKGKLKTTMTQQQFSLFISKLYQTRWISYCKPPFGGAAQVLDYLGRYTHRVAISNRRIIALEKDAVSFAWRDYSDNNKTKVMTLPAKEFMRRFLLHVLPRGFFKIRYYGLLSRRNKGKLLARAQKLTIHFGNKNKLEGKSRTYYDAYVCPCCKKATMIITGSLPALFSMGIRSP